MLYMDDMAPTSSVCGSSDTPVQIHGVVPYGNNHLLIMFAAMLSLVPRRIICVP